MYGKKILITALSRSYNLGKKSFSSGMLAILPLPPSLQNFFCYFYNALDSFASKIKGLSNIKKSSWESFYN